MKEVTAKVQSKKQKKKKRQALEGAHLRPVYFISDSFRTGKDANMLTGCIFQDYAA